MSTLYWFNVIGGIHICFMVLTIIFTITAFVFFIGWLYYICDEDTNMNTTKIFKNLKKYSIISLLFGMLTCFTPSTRELYLIYGVGGIIDYLKENPTAQELPDKCVQVLDKYLNEQLEDNEH